MTQTQFEETVRRYLYHKPYIPFIIDLVDGRSFVIDGQGLSFNNGFVCYFDPDYQFNEFTCAEVKAIRAVTLETPHDTQ
jgi:hypothetical protein